MKKLWIFRIFFKNLSKTQNIIVNRSSGWKLIVCPKSIQNLIAGNHLIFSGIKQLNQLHFAFTQFLFFIRKGILYLKRCRKHFVFSNTDFGRDNDLFLNRLRQNRTPQNKFFEIKRFGQIIIRPQFQSGNAVNRVSFC
ncbi:hypothetical protein D3C71_992560 [compost metagenome]